MAFNKPVGKSEGGSFERMVTSKVDSYKKQDFPNMNPKIVAGFKDRTAISFGKKLVNI